MIRRMGGYVTPAANHNPGGNYIPDPLDQPRPAQIQCGFIFRYGSTGSSYTRHTRETTAAYRSSSAPTTP